MPKFAKGFHQIERPKDLKTLTLKELEQTLTSIFRDRAKSPAQFSLYQSCKTKGIVNRTDTDLGLCGDPECPSCSEFAKLLHEEMKKEPNLTNFNFK